MATDQREGTAARQVETRGPAREIAEDNKQDVSVLWRRILKKDSVPYEFGRRGPLKKDRGGPESGTIAIQIESAAPEHSELLLSRYNGPGSIFGRHGEAAAAILNKTADRVAGENVAVHFIERPVYAEKWAFDPDSHYAQALFKADIVSYSMGIPAYGNQAEAYSGGSVDTLAEIEAADKFWASTHALFFKSAGNSGDESWGLQRAHAHNYVRGDTYALIGEAREDEDGPYIAAHSSRSGSSFVVHNPFFEGFAYPYIRDKDELRQRVNNLLDQIPEGETRTAREIFLEAVKNQWSPEDLGKFFFFAPFLEKFDGPPLKSCHLDFNNAAFEGKKDLLRSVEWQRKNPEKVLDAYINGMVAALEYERDSMDADKRGRIKEVSGTSFAGPYAAGLVAGIKEKYPRLNEYDVMAAALLAAEPVYSAATIDGWFDDVWYEDNGAGLPHNDCYGYGLMTPKNLKRQAARMDKILRRFPQLASVEARAHSELVRFEGDNKGQAVWETYNEEKGLYEYMPAGNIEEDREAFALAGIEAQLVYEYKIEVDEDITALRSHLIMDFAGGSDTIPEFVELLSPAGGGVYMSPTRLSGDMEYSLASGDGHFANHTEGTWTLRVWGTELEAAQIDVSGVEKGGLIDMAVKRYVRDLEKARKAAAEEAPEVEVLPAPQPETAPAPEAVNDNQAAFVPQSIAAPGLSFK